MTNGSETGHILRFALPLLMGNLLQQLYNVADTVIVGKRLGDDALAAVGATGSITYLFYTLCMGLSVGTGIIISQYFGAGMLKQMKSAVFNSAIVTAIFAVAVSIVSVFLAEPLLSFLNTPAALLPTAAGYMRISCAGTIAVAAYNWINAVMRSLGDAKSPLIFLAAASAMNVVLDLIFVIVFGWGVNGAALATIIAQGCSALFGILYAFSKNKDIQLQKDDLKPESQMMLRCIRTGLPIAGQNAMISVSMVALQRVTNTFGETVMAAYTASMRIEQLIQQPFSSLNAAVSTFTGQNIGAEKNERAVKGLRTGLKLSAIFSAAMVVVFMLFGKYITWLFVNGSEVIGIGTMGIQLTSLFYVFLGAIHVTRGFLNGAGDTGYALINGAAEVVSRIGFSLLLTSIAAVGYRGIWLTTCITWALTAVISIIRYKSGVWKKKSITKSAQR